MNKKEIGVYAGRVWRLLVDNTKWSYSELQRKSGLRDNELGFALGWLAHEDMIEFEQDDQELYIYQCMNVYIG